MVAIEPLTGPAADPVLAKVILSQQSDHQAIGPLSLGVSLEPEATDVVLALFGNIRSNVGTALRHEPGTTRANSIPYQSAPNLVSSVADDLGV